MKLGLIRGRIARLLLLAMAPILVSIAVADEIHVASSGGFAAAYPALAPGFGARTGHKLVAVWGPSMGEPSAAIAARRIWASSKSANCCRFKALIFLGEIPEETQQFTPFSAGIVSSSKQHSAAQASVDYLTSDEAAPLIRKTGLTPAIATAHESETP